MSEPKHGWPTPLQVKYALVIIRRRHGSKNSLRAVRAFVAAHAHTPDVGNSKAFLFGVTVDEEGYPYVGCGDDNDSFIVGGTLLALLNNCIKYVSPGRYTMFHADATIKLSDLGFPVITCSSTDSARPYQLAAIFVVSRRTAREYHQCFLSRLFKALRGTTIDVNAVMGDAEDAQSNAYADIEEFKRSHILMCFFHILYNVRKRTRHLNMHFREIVMKGIMDMHFTTSEEDFELTRHKILALWRFKRLLDSFITYFETQWMRGRYRHWQGFHSPEGYATTNNPCEIFNASMKRFFQRRRWHMQLSLQKLMELIQVVHTRSEELPTEAGLESEER